MRWPLGLQLLHLQLTPTSSAFIPSDSLSLDTISSSDVIASRWVGLEEPYNVRSVPISAYIMPMCEEGMLCILNSRPDHPA